MTHNQPNSKAQKHKSPQLIPSAHKKHPLHKIMQGDVSIEPI